MPGMDGVETARRIRMLGLAPPPHIVMITAYGRDEMLNNAEEAGVEEVLTKPMTPSVLFDAAVRAMRGEKRKKINLDNRSEHLEAQLASLEGAHILLVEDNEINQEVAVELLSAVGLRVEIAVNGQDAVDMVQIKSFDLILMDMQMPVMDGVTATIEIRKKPGLTTLPIIAMTANAMQQDRDACIVAGMNDYIAKPIDPVQLWTILLKWIHPGQPQINAGHSAKASVANSTELPESIAGIDIQLGLRRVLGKKERYLSMLRKFHAGYGETVTELRSALASQQWELAGRLVHTVKGVAGNIGATPLQACASDLELAIRQRGEQPLDESLIHNFEYQLSALISELGIKLPSERRTVPVPVNTAELRSVCDQLAALLEEDDAKARKLIEIHNDLLSAAFNDDFAPLQAAIKKFDFGSALTLLEKIRNKAYL